MLLRLPQALLPGGLAATALIGPAAEGPAHVYRPGTAFRTTTTVELVTETTDSEFLVDGEPREGRGGGGASSVQIVVEHVDRVVEAVDGAPRQIVRGFERVEQESVRSFGEEQRSSSAESPFEELVIELVLDDDDELQLEVLEGSEPDAELLEGHRLNSAVDALLPPDGTEVGDAWGLDGEAVRAALMLDLEPLLFPPVEAAPPADGGRGGRGGRGGGRGGGGARGLAAPDAEWSGEATLASLEGELDGVEVALIELEFSAEGDLPEPEGGPGGGRGGRGGALRALPGSPRDNTYTYELEGVLYWHTAEQRPLLLELEGTLTTDTERAFEARESWMEMRSTRVGEWTQTTRFQTVEDDE